MKTSRTAHFDRQCQSHLKHLKLKGPQAKTIDAYARAIRRMGTYFLHCIDDLSEAQLTDYSAIWSPPTPGARSSSTFTASSFTLSMCCANRGSCRT
ncbi:hypothetical protein [Noviherbaspirillum saxi]|uniref:hypothetical protein n=1 Tax=Noviherbaspirillum saxi TaxID=2320863 RepID=UPI0018F499AC|nr:hypothetical protein [Noviherbaspirillum saxi]